MIICPIHEFNFCHLPAGREDGGRFCSKDSAWWSSGRVAKSRRATKGEMQPATGTQKKRLGIPPAYTDVKVATDPKAELRATAVDAKGRVHSYYSKRYLDRQQAAKWSRVGAMHRELPKLLAKLERATNDPDRDGYDEAMTLRLISQTGFRNGGEATGENESFGASSLRLDHIELHGDQITFRFPGKGGKAQDHTLTDGKLADYVRHRRSVGAAELFPHTADETYAYMQRVTNGRFKVHDLRTWYGTAYADRLVQQAVADGLTPSTKKEFKAFRKEIGTRVAEALGNTPAIALKTYIHPAVFKPWEPS